MLLENPPMLSPRNVAVISGSKPEQFPILLDGNVNESSQERDGISARTNLRTYLYRTWAFGTITREEGMDNYRCWEGPKRLRRRCPLG
jgi:hypothetical protein